MSRKSSQSDEALAFAVRVAAKAIVQSYERLRWPVNPLLQDFIEKAAQRLEEVANAKPEGVPKAPIVAESLAAVSPAAPAIPSPESEETCGCGKPIHYHGMCKVRAAKAQARKAQDRQLQQQGKPRIGRPPNRAPRKPGKWCPGCQALRPLAEFAKDSTRRDGLQNRCRACFNRRNRERWHRQKAVAGPSSPADYDAVLAEKVGSGEPENPEMSLSAVTDEEPESYADRPTVSPDITPELPRDPPPLRTHGLAPKLWKLQDLTPEQQERRRRGLCVTCGLPKTKSPYASCRSCMGQASRDAEKINVRDRGMVN